MLQLEVFVLELGAVDALTTSAVTIGEVTSLEHELRDDTVEGRTLVTKSMLSCAQFSEVLCSFGNDAECIV